VINTIKSRLAGWQSRFLSYGGHLILLKFVLTSLRSMLFPFSKLHHVSFLLLNLFLTNFFEEGVRITGKFPGLLGALFVYRRRKEGCG